MKCQIGEAIEKIDKLISNNSKVDDNTINQLIKVKKKLNSVKDIRMSRMQSNNTGSESKTPEFDKKGFNGYVSIKDTGGKGSAEGDAKDKAMREVANGFIGEFAYRAGVNTIASSTLTSVKTISNKDKSSPSAFGNSNTISYIPKNTANNIDGFTYNSGYYYSKEHIKKTYKIIGSSYGKKEDNSNAVPKILAKELVKFMQSIQSDSDVSDIIDYLGENKNNEKNAVDTRGHKLYKDVIELLPKLAKAVRKGQAGGEKYNSISMKEDIDNLFVLLDLGKDLVKKIIEDTPFKLIQDNSYEKDYYSIGSRYIDGLTAGSDVLSVKTVMLAKNSNNRFKESYPEDSYKKFAETLREFTKELIDEAHNSGATFVVGDMPGVDTQFIEYLNKIGASYKVYTTNEAGKEFDRKGIDGSKYRNIVETKSQNETKSVEPEIKYGSVVKYKPENGIEGYYVVRGFSANGGLQLTDGEGKNFSGTPNVNKVKFVKQLEIKRYNNVDYIIDSNNKVYTQNGKVADSYVNQIIGKKKTEAKENDTNSQENKNTNNKIKSNLSERQLELVENAVSKSKDISMALIKISNSSEKDEYGRTFREMSIPAKEKLEEAIKIHEKFNKTQDKKVETNKESTLSEELEYLNNKDIFKGKATQKSQVIEYVEYDGDTSFGIVHKMLDGTMLVYDTEGKFVNELSTGFYINDSIEGSLKESFESAITVLKNLTDEKKEKLKERIEKEGLRNKEIKSFLKAGINEKVRDIKISDEDLEILKKENEKLTKKTGVSIKWIENDANADFNYNPDDNSVTYVEGFNDTITTVLQNHELKHALTFQYLKNNENDPKVAEIIRGVSDFNDRLINLRAKESMNYKKDDSESYISKTNDLYERVDYMLKNSTDSKISNELRQVSEIVAILSAEKDIRDQFLNEFKSEEKSKLKRLLEWIKSKLSFKDVKVEYFFSPENIVKNVDEIVKQSSKEYKKNKEYTELSEPDVVNNNKYEIISKDDIEAAKDIMSNNKKECE